MTDGCRKNDIGRFRHLGNLKPEGGNRAFLERAECARVTLSHPVPPADRREINVSVFYRSQVGATAAPAPNPQNLRRDGTQKPSPRGPYVEASHLFRTRRPGVWAAKRCAAQRSGIRRRSSPRPTPRARPVAAGAHKRVGALSPYKTALILVCAV